MERVYSKALLQNKYYIAALLADVGNANYANAQQRRILRKNFNEKIPADSSGILSLRRDAN